MLNSRQSLKHKAKIRTQKIEKFLTKTGFAFSLMLRKKPKKLNMFLVKAIYH